MSIKPGAIRFNTDSMKLEIFRGSANYNGTASMAGIGTLAAGQWEEIQATSPDVQTGGTRGVIAGGTLGDGTPLTSIRYVTISSTGDSINFGDLQQHSGSGGLKGVSSRTRGVFMGRATYPSVQDTMEYITISSTGNSADFGDLTRTTAECNGAAASPTRAIFAGQGPSAADTIDYIEILSTGNAVDFGNLGTLRSHAAGCSNGHGGL